MAGDHLSGVTARALESSRNRSRSRLRRAAKRLDRYERRLFHRCENRRERSRRSRRRPAFLSAIQGGFPLSAIRCRRRRARALNDLAESIDEARMIRLNAEAERTKELRARCATIYLSTENASPFVRKHSATNFCAGWPAISSSPAFRCFFAIISECRWELSPAAAAPSGT